MAVKGKRGRPPKVIKDDDGAENVDYSNVEAGERFPAEIPNMDMGGGVIPDPDEREDFKDRNVDVDPETEEVSTGVSMHRAIMESIVKPLEIQADAEFPKPPTIYFQRDPEGFFKYWANLPQVFLDRAIVYIYRMWPVLNKIHCLDCGVLLQEKSGSQPNYECSVCGWKGKLPKYTGKHTSPLTQEQVLGQYGTGKYEFKMIDTGTGKIVCRCALTTPVDYGKYPPNIPDLRDVDVHIPANQSYVQWARANKLVFPQLKKQGSEEEEDMANMKVIEPVMVQLGKLTDKLLERSEPKTEPRRDTSDEAVSKGIGLVAQAAGESNKMLTETFRQLTEMRADPLSQVKEVIGVLKEGGLVGGQYRGQGGIEIVQTIVPLIEGMMTREANMNRAVMDMTSAALKAAEAKSSALENRLMEFLMKQNQSQANPNGVAPDLAAEINKVKELQKLFGGGKESKSGEEDKPVWERVLDKMAPMLPMVVLALASKAGVNPAAPGQPIPDQTQSVNPQNTPQAYPQPQTPEQAQQQKEADMQQQIMELFALLQPKLIEQLQLDQPDGIQFAEGFRQWVPMGGMKHTLLRNVGQEAIAGYLEMYGSPELRTIIQMRPDVFKRFIWEFLNPEEALAQLEAQEAEEDGEVSGASGTPVQ